MSVLGKGLNFIPVSKHCDEFQTKNDAEIFYRCACIKAFSYNFSDLSSNRDFFQRLSPRKPNWVPADGLFVFLDLFIIKYDLGIANPVTILMEKLSFSNLFEE